MSDSGEQNSRADSDWLSELADAAVPTPASTAQFAPETIQILPPVVRVRPARHPLVPRVAWIALSGFVAVIAATLLVVLLVTKASAITVPNVTGSQIGVARTDLKRLGLHLAVSERRFGTVPKDQILSQTPSAGSSVHSGDSVAVVVSAGTEEFAMPDVVGNGIALARGTLEARGLVIVLELVTSDVTSDTVLGTVPAAGATVRTGDRVKVQVAATRGSTSFLQPYRMIGLSVVLDPAPAMSADPALEIARRLRALLEASGATVRMTRTGSDSSLTEAQRAARVAEASSTVGIGLQITETGSGGRVVSSPATLTPFVGPTSAALANCVIQSFTGSLDPVTRVEATPADPVFGSLQMPWIRVTLGSASAHDDASSFGDPGWADVAARAIYRALGEVYGTKESQ